MVALERCSLFNQASAQEVDLVRQVARQRSYRAGEEIFKEGDPGDGMYVIVEGLVELSGVMGTSDRRSFSRAGPGEIFGEMAVVEDQPRSATALALESTSAYFIGREDVLNLIKTSPGLALALLRHISARLREFNQHYLSEVLQSERLAVIGRFARSIVHDLKNPLHTISLTAELIALQAGVPQGKERADHILTQVGRISDLIGEILDFTQGSHTDFVMAPLDYGLFVTRIAEDIRPEAALRRVEIDLQPVPEVDALINPKRLRRVFHNLVGNAGDAMQSGGRITIRVRVEGAEVITELEDTGPGIAPEIAASLFEPFATHGKEHGTGLGLSICRRILQDHRGWITGRNTPGGGAVFAFGLPLSRKA